MNLLFDKDDALHELTLATSSTRNAIDAIQKIDQVIRQIIPHDTRLLFWNDSERKFFVAPKAYNENLATAAALTLPYDDPLVKKLLHRAESCHRIKPDSSIVPGIQIELIVPLKSPISILGCLYLGRAQDNTFTAKELKLAEHIATMLTIIIERTMWNNPLDPQTQKSVDVQSKITQFISACSRARKGEGVEGVIQNIACELKSIIDFDFLSISLLTDKNSNALYFDLSIKAIKSLVPKSWRWEHIPGSEIGWLRHPKEDAEHKPGVDSLSPQRMPYTMPTHSSILLMSGENYIGNCALGRSGQEPFSKTDLTFFKSIAPVIAIMVENARRSETIEQLMQEIAAFEKFSQAISQSHEQQEILDHLCTTVSEALRPDQVNYILKNDENNADELLPKMPLIVQQYLSLDQIMQIFQILSDTGKALFVDTPQRFLEQFRHQDISTADLAFFQPFIIAPLFWEEQRIGCLLVVWKGNYTLSDHDLKVITTLNSLTRNAFEKTTVSSQSAKKAEELESFVYTVSHELKSPIQTVKSYAALLHDEYSAVFPPEAKKYLERIQANMDQMQKLIMDLLDLSRVGRVEAKMEQFESREAVQSAIASLSGLIKKYPTEIMVQKNLPQVHGIKTGICQVFTNLISNAIKFSRNSANPTIEIGCAVSDENYRFYVKDNGAGINPELHEKIFELFHTRDVAESDMGSGVGLAIVKKVIDLHNGRIWVESLPENGATFYFTIPIEHHAKK